jgi:hypothetical protein
LPLHSLTALAEQYSFLPLYLCLSLPEHYGTALSLSLVSAVTVRRRSRAGRSSHATPLCTLLASFRSADHRSTGPPLTLARNPCSHRHCQDSEDDREKEAVLVKGVLQLPLLATTRGRDDAGEHVRIDV